MPWQPLRRCSYPSCTQRVTSGRCEKHRREQNRQRGTRTERGYNNRWRKYRLMYLKTHPLCVHCLKQNSYTPATIVDHIIPINSDSDVLFWPISNHQALCHACHNRKTVQTDPITKAKRKQGAYREQEAEAARLFITRIITK
ncbi:HNH endonuclease signature motif containing protein [Xenorhabdus sp. KK7.4]|uniref:HNH endonuclease signature motif containing protein n=1 Tax=Xenorhabdus sp. KK7.4 TaxID=1851572 RepID=UPI000C052E08|nr:HNH endonuclease [Xenorhabdus sp. KK7.4]PHM47985.1 HNH endonuclease [Xenorhabdus sp. KK7.4]PHM49560.1 HNH endonuclease [Xenorhabdus sp. KK7.4]